MGHAPLEPVGILMAFDLTRRAFENLRPRFMWQPGGNGDSRPGFGNVCDDHHGVILAQEVPEDFGVWLADLLNVIEAMDLLRDVDLKEIFDVSPAPH